MTQQHPHKISQPHRRRNVDKLLKEYTSDSATLLCYRWIQLVQDHIMFMDFIARLVTIMLNPCLGAQSSNTPVADNNAHLQNEPSLQLSNC